MCACVHARVCSSFFIGYTVGRKILERVHNEAAHSCDIFPIKLSEVPNFKLGGGMWKVRLFLLRTASVILQTNYFVILAALLDSIFSVALFRAVCVVTSVALSGSATDHSKQREQLAHSF